MGEYWLVKNLFNNHDSSDPLFSFLGSANWMRALAIKSSNLNENPMDAKQFYSPKVTSRCSKDKAIQALESHYKALHYIASVKSIALLKKETYDLIRSAIISWYYVLYFASQAFLWAKCSRSPDNHSTTAKQLQYHVILKGLFIDPFNMNVPTILEKEFEKHVSKNYPCDRYKLKDEPLTTYDAQSALVAYLRGTAKYMRERVEQDLRKDPAFKNLQVDNFRTRKARELRDQWFQKKNVNILVQAFRYRGKANYRDGLYLSYGKDNIEKICKWTDDMHYVAKAFMIMITTYLKFRIPSNLWDEYCKDIEIHTRFNLDKDLLMQT